MKNQSTATSRLPVADRYWFIYNFEITNLKKTPKAKTRMLKSNII